LWCKTSSLHKKWGNLGGSGTKSNPYVVLKPGQTAKNKTTVKKKITVSTYANTVWKSNVVLGSKGGYKYAGIYGFNNLTIGNNVEVTSKGISQLVIKVKGTLKLGKNAVIRVRNGYYSDAPENSISSLNSKNLIARSTINTGDFCLYDNMFGKGGNGGNGGAGGFGQGHSYYYLGKTISYSGTGGSGGGGGAGGFGGGIGGAGGMGGGHYNVPGEPDGSNGYAGLSGDDNGGKGGFGGNGSDGGAAGGAIGIGGQGNNGGWKHIGNGGGGGGGNGANGFSGDVYTNPTLPKGNGRGGSGGGAGGYGGGILTIIANKIVYDKQNPPKFIVSGQRGGYGAEGIIGGGDPGRDGKNGDGGLLIVNSQSFTYSLNMWQLGKSTYGKNVTPSANGGHGIVTGNPQKVFINGVEIITGKEKIIKNVTTNKKKK
jgi:hypothetical protein